MAEKCNAKNVGLHLISKSSFFAKKVLLANVTTCSLYWACFSKQEDVELGELFTCWVGFLLTINIQSHCIVCIYTWLKSNYNEIRSQSDHSAFCVLLHINMFFLIQIRYPGRETTHRPIQINPPDGKLLRNFFVCLFGKQTGFTVAIVECKDFKSAFCLHALSKSNMSWQSHTCSRIQEIRIFPGVPSPAVNQRGHRETD